MSRTLKDMLDKGVEAAETEFAMDIFFDLFWLTIS